MDPRTAAEMEGKRKGKKKRVKEAKDNKWREENPEEAAAWDDY